MKKNMICLNFGIIFVLMTLVACGTDIQGDSFNTALRIDSVGENYDDMKFFVIADAGHDLVTVKNNPIRLHGKNIETDVEIKWTITSQPDGSYVTLSDSTLIDPLFEADTLGDYELELELTNDISTSSDVLVVSVKKTTEINSLGMEFRLVSAKDQIISLENQVTSGYVTTQILKVDLQGYYLMTTEVTQEQWQNIMGANPSYHQPANSAYDYPDCPTCPVENFSLEKINEFILEMNKRGEGVYRLPTLDELGYAARAGSTSEFANGELCDETQANCGQIDPVLDEIGWYYGNSKIALFYSVGGYVVDKAASHPVGQKMANTWGFYDLHGNILELAVSYNYYSNKGLVTNSEILQDKELFKFGGAFDSSSESCTSDSFYNYSTTSQGTTGLRLVLVP